MLGSNVLFEKLIFEASGYSIESPLGHSLIAPGSATIQVNAGSVTIAAPVTVANVLTKSGAGTLQLNSTVNAASTLVEAGAAVINGTLASSEVTVSGGANLSVNGSLTGNLLNRGYVAVDGIVSGNVSNDGNIDVNGVIIGNVSNQSYLSVDGTVRGSVSNDGDIDVNGALIGNVSNQGYLSVEGIVRGSVLNHGHLKVNGTVDGDVHNYSLLTGTGLITGDLWSSGTVAPGNSIGTLSVGGNFTQTSAGTLQIEVASASRHDGLLVSGTAKLAGTLEILSLGYDAAYGDQIPFLIADEITGKFNRIELPLSDDFRGRFVSEGGLGVLLVAPASYTLVANTPNERSLARALDEWIGVESGDIGEVTLALDLLRKDQYTAAFHAIMPGFYESALSTGAELSQNHGQILHQQLSARRLGDRFVQGASAGPILSAEASGKDPKKVQTSNASEQAASEDYRWNAWTMGSGLFSEGGLSLQPGEDFESGTYLAGADYAFSEHFALGLFASYQEGWGDYDLAGDMDLESTRFGGYATFDFGGFYANAVIGGGQTGFDVKRPIQWAYLDRDATSEPDGYEFFTSISAGYDIKAGYWTFGPQLTAQYSDLHLGEFTEVGAGSLNLRVKEADMESLRHYLGGRVAYTIKVSDTFAIIPELRAFWQHEYLEGGDISAQLDSGFGGSFGYQTNEPEKDAVYVGAGLGFQIGPRIYANIYYNADFGRNDDANHTVSVSATLKF